jgi:hypothetical protein
LICIFLAATNVTGFVAEPVINYLYDWLGSYGPVYYAAAIMDVVLVVLYLILFGMCKKDKQKYLQEHGE